MYFFFNWEGAGGRGAGAAWQGAGCPRDGAGSWISRVVGLRVAVMAEKQN